MICSSVIAIRNKKSKGFTLFTALVGFIVIAIGLLVIQHMNNSEENYTQIIVGMKNQSEMEAIKDTLRLEGFNIFNFLFRLKFYTYLNDATGLTGQAIPIDYKSYRVNGIDDYKLKFENDIFFRMGNPEECSGDSLCLDDLRGNNAFATFLSTSIANQLYDFSGTVRGTYTFKVYDPVSHQERLDASLADTDLFALTYNTSNRTLEMTGAIGTVLVDTKLQRPLLTVMNCEARGDCEEGTFYVNADFSQIPDSKYFQIPRMFLFNKEFSAIDDAIIPKSYLMFYVPFRIFGAIDFAYGAIGDNAEDFSGIDETYGTVKTGTTVITNGSLSSIGSCDGSTSDLGLTTYSPEDNSALYTICAGIENEATSNDFSITYCELETVPYTTNTYTIADDHCGANGYSIVNQKISEYYLDIKVKDNSQLHRFGTTNLTYPLRFLVKIIDDPLPESVCKEISQNGPGNWQVGNDC